MSYTRSESIYRTGTRLLVSMLVSYNRFLEAVFLQLYFAISTECPALSIFSWLTYSWGFHEILSYAHPQIVVPEQHEQDGSCFRHQLYRPTKVIVTCSSDWVLEGNVQILPINLIRNSIPYPSLLPLGSSRIMWALSEVSRLPLEWMRVTCTSYYKSLAPHRLKCSPPLQGFHLWKLDCSLLQ